MEKNQAGFWIRFLAVILDSLIISVVAGLITGNWFSDVNERNGLEGILQILYGIIVPIIWMGYTIGKRIVGIRIVKMDGSNVTIGTMLMRNLVASLVYLATFGIGVIVSAFMIGIREDKRSIHDLIANTYVTYNKP